MTRVVVCAHNVVNFPEGGGHLWVFVQYVRGLTAAGCEVWWLEQFRRGADAAADARRLSEHLDRLRSLGLDGRVLVYAPSDDASGRQWLAAPPGGGETVLRSADLLLNFHYAIDPDLLALARRTALVDIDPGLLQFWMAAGQLAVPLHDRYLTIGETVGAPGSAIPDCGLDWVRFRPPVSLADWAVARAAPNPAFTTVAGWWAGEYVRGPERGREVFYENTKRMAFLRIAELPRLTSQPLELALYLGPGDAVDRQALEHRGWRVRHSREVARTPDMYRDYIQRSRGEFSVVKPSCVRLQNAWISDRTLCYLASGKPAVVEHTGPSADLPNGIGLFRFATIADAAAALDAVNTDYRRHCRAARELAEAYFEATAAARDILEAALGGPRTVTTVARGG